MNIELERSEIIEEIKHVSDEWLLKAIKRLLGLDHDNDISEEHKQILDSRINAYESGQVKPIEWEEAKKRLSGK
jgi:putative addiction module component